MRDDEPVTARRTLLALAAGVALLAVACSSATPPPTAQTTRATPPRPSTSAAPRTTTSPSPTASPPTHEFTFAFAGDVHFMDRTAARLAANPATAFGEAAAVLSKADLTMVNLETAITTRGQPANKSFTFRAPPSALTALRDAGIDLATMANNHGADYGSVGLQDTLAAIAASHFPVIGIGANAAQAYAPYTATVHGVKIAVIAASQVQDETLANFTAGDSTPGIASAWSDRLVQAVRAAKAGGATVIVYLHWGTEYTNCPNQYQRTLADTLAAAGATAVVGTHAHELQGAGWRPDGVYVAYGLSNYLWWRSFGNLQDDAGVLTLTIRPDRVVAASFSPAHLDARGVPMPATGPERARIDAEWQQDRQCAGLAAAPPH